jgi:hypothetical protein
VDIFEREGVKPDCWVAPAHSFDRVTLKVLSRAGIRTISDGYFAYPHRDSQGILWIPEQGEAFRRMPFGVWTICIHHNGWQRHSVARFRQEVRKYGSAITSLREVVRLFAERPLSNGDVAFNWGIRIVRKVKAAILSRGNAGRQRFERSGQ